MADYDIRLEQAANKAEIASEQLHDFVNGPDTWTISTESGPLPTIAKFIKDEKAIVEAQVAEAADDVAQAVVDAQTAQAAAESARDAAQLSAGVYVDTAAGLAATTSGQYFSVPSADAAEYLILYKNNVGVAQEIKRYPSTGGIFSSSLDLFRRNEDNLFPLANLLVRRYTATATFNDYSAGYSQTAVAGGLRVAIPTAGSGTIKHYVRTGITSEGATKITAEFNDLDSISESGAVGVGYLTSGGVYTAYVLSKSGNFFKIEGFSSTLITSGLGNYTTGDDLKFVVEKDVLSAFVNGVLVKTHSLSDGEFDTELLMAQIGFATYVGRFNFVADPVREYVAQEVAVNANYPEGFYSYSPTGSLSGSGQFKAFSKISGNKYVGFEIGRTVNMADLVYVDYWRIERAKFYTYNGSAMIDTGVIAIDQGESECVWKRNSSKDDFTGGYHGDEILQDVSFFASGVKVDSGLLGSSIALTPCSDFYYLEKSTMHATAEGGSFIPGHPIECYHTKLTRIQNAGYETFNRLKWAAAGLVTLWYHGISCIGKSAANKGYTEDTFTETTFDGTNVKRLQSIGHREMHGWNATSGYSAFVTSEIFKPSAEDATATLFIQDRSADSKYYREMDPVTVSVDDVWESVMTVRFAVSPL